MGIPVFLIFLAFALPASWADIRSYRIPDRLVFPCLALALAFLLYADPASLPAGLAAALLSGLFFFIIRKATKGLGLGDVKFAALIGLCCGPSLACAAFLCAAALGIAFILAGRRRGTEKLRRPIPFAPFLTAGVIAVFGLSRIF
jgi:Flp pilus assembly protein protease CpaA